MKVLLRYLLVSLICCSCSNGEASVKTETTTDTIMNNTNPGVGSAVDDTATQIEKN